MDVMCNLVENGTLLEYLKLYVDILCLHNLHHNDIMSPTQKLSYVNHPFKHAHLTQKKYVISSNILCRKF